jgi:2-oxoglutarate ferredoxin oxidoreductase subunit gamma
MKEGRHVTYLPIYGVEMRGGTANCTVVISSREIGSPIVQRPGAAIVMNQPSLEKYEPRVQSRGLLVINSSLTDPQAAARDDLNLLAVPANDIAHQTGGTKFANMVALGAFIEKTRWIRPDSLFESLEHVLDSRYHSLIPSNVTAIQKGQEYARSLR